MGFLKCKSCDGFYELQPGESPDMFESCHCGGELEYYDSRGQKKRYEPIYQGERNRSKSFADFFIKVIIVLVVLFVILYIFSFVFSLFMILFMSLGSTAGFSLVIAFMIILIGIILLLLGFYLKDGDNEE